MGPLLFRAEDHSNGLGFTLEELASMGPLLFRAEDRPPPKPLSHNRL